MKTLKTIDFFLQNWFIYFLSKVHQFICEFFFLKPKISSLPFICIEEAVFPGKLLFDFHYSLGKKTPNFSLINPKIEFDFFFICDGNAVTHQKSFWSFYWLLGSTSFEFSNQRKEGSDVGEVFSPSFSCVPDQSRRKK